VDVWPICKSYTSVRRADCFVYISNTDIDEIGFEDATVRSNADHTRALDTVGICLENTQHACLYLVDCIVELGDVFFLELEADMVQCALYLCAMIE
jgi:hypothetical protein